MKNKTKELINLIFYKLNNNENLNAKITKSEVEELVSYLMNGN